MIVSGVLVSFGVERWLGSDKPVGSLSAPAEASGLLLEDAGTGADANASESLQLTSPPPLGLCQVHDVPLHRRRPNEVLYATADAPTSVRATKFPRAPFFRVPKRVLVYE